MTIAVSIPVTVTKQDIEDIVVTAIEGGIGYWACLDNSGKDFEDAPEDEPVSITTSKILLAGGSIRLLDDEDRSVAWDLTLSKLLKGISTFLATSSGIQCIDCGGIDCGMIDAYGADSIIQFALFEEQVFG